MVPRGRPGNGASVVHEVKLRGFRMHVEGSYMNCLVGVIFDNCGIMLWSVVYMHGKIVVLVDYSYMWRVWVNATGILQCSRF